MCRRGPPEGPGSASTTAKAYTAPTTRPVSAALRSIQHTPRASATTHWVGATSALRLRDYRGDRAIGRGLVVPAVRTARVAPVWVCGPAVVLGVTSTTSPHHCSHSAGRDRVRSERRGFRLTHYAHPSGSGAIHILCHRAHSSRAQSAGSGRVRVATADYWNGSGSHHHTSVCSGARSCDYHTTSPRRPSHTSSYTSTARRSRVVNAHLWTGSYH